MRTEMTANTFRQALIAIFEHLKNVKGFPAGKVEELQSAMKKLDDEIKKVKREISTLKTKINRLSEIITNLMKALGES